MKKITLALALVLAVNAFGEGFRNVEWGSDLATVKKSEKNKKMEVSKDVQDYGKYHWERQLYSFEDSMKSAGKFNVEYVMLKDKLIKGSYTQKIKDGDLTNYTKMQKILVDKYGAPQGSAERSSLVSKDGKEVRETEVILTWFGEKTRIDMKLINNERYQISYLPTDEKIIKFVEESGLERERAKEKELMKDSEYIKNFI
ncbi:hypothetical protein PM10SUCC1_07660 [Propionigenium maris DSM 9537]|uniref:Uncharacterized protein n=1 Tax=Propionigenium maris DSM 9537 TaxID=1123000 RepID=A0A9W6GK59_9FUSO|nr:hypothetical protein [Propionigenium maris]GLI55251.1 hypothetical protein PM10SUCC1_07660 [Propionigenium maris DSM 9537]